MKIKRLSAEPSCKLGNSHSFAFQPDLIQSHAAALIGNNCHDILGWSLLSENKIRYCWATLHFRFQMDPLLFMSQHWILTMLEMQSGVSQWRICERPCLKWTHFRPEKPISLTSRVILSFYRRAQWASLLCQLLPCASIFRKWISWFGSRLMRGSGAPQIAVMRQMFGRLEWRQERKSRSGGTDAQNGGKGPTPCRQMLLTSWRSGEKQGPDGEGRERWKVNHSHMWSVGTAIWTLHLISSPSPRWLCYEFYLHFLLSLILYVISCPFAIAVFLPPPIHLSPSCILLKLFLNFQTSLPFALLLYFPLSVLCLVSFDSGQMSCSIQLSNIHFWS